MQTLGFLVINNKKILVLVRSKKHVRQLRLRRTGRHGIFFEDESIFISKNRHLLEKLTQGKTIEV